MANRTLSLAFRTFEAFQTMFNLFVPPIDLVSPPMVLTNAQSEVLHLLLLVAVAFPVGGELLCCSAFLHRAKQLLYLFFGHKNSPPFLVIIIPRKRG